MRGCRGVTLRAQMLFVLVQCKSALFVCPTGGASGGWGAVGSATRWDMMAITATVTHLLLFIKILLCQDSVLIELSKAIIQNLLFGLAIVPKAVAKARIHSNLLPIVGARAAVLVPG